MVREHVTFNHFSKRTESNPTGDIMTPNFNTIGCQIYNMFKTIYLNVQIFNITCLESVCHSLSLYKTYNVSELIPPAVFRWKRYEGTTTV